MLDGALEHRDSEGNHGVIRPGLAQRMSAGTGIRHSEANASATEPVHLLQMWVVPDTSGIPPEYEEVDVSDRLKPTTRCSRSRPDVSPTPRFASTSATRRCGSRVCTPVRAVTIPDAPFVHVFVASGDATLDGAGELARRRRGPPHRRRRPRADRRPRRRRAHRLGDLVRGAITPELDASVT